MIRLVPIVVLVVVLGLAGADLFAHGNKHVDNSVADGLTYSEEVAGMQADLAIDKVKKIQKQEKKLYACDVKVQLFGAENIPAVNIAVVALRFTSGTRASAWLTD